MITFIDSHRVLLLLVFSLTFLSANTYGTESVSSTPPGFQVVEVNQDRSTQLVHIVLNISGGDQVVPLIYFSKKGWAADAPSQWDVQNHPCRTGNDICCLNTFW